MKRSEDIKQQLGVINKKVLIAVMGMDELSEGESMQKGEQMAKDECWGGPY